MREFSLRAGSGGNGQHKGGDGVIRDVEFRIPVQVSILSERRVYHPYGLHGGEDAQCGKNIWVRKLKRKGEDGTEDVVERHISLGSKNTASMQPGERIIVMTPGGGGYGKVGDKRKVRGRDDHEKGWKKGSHAARQSEQEASV